LSVAVLPVPSCNLFDLSDLHTGDADEVIGLQPGHVGELGCVGVGRFPETQLPEDREQSEDAEQAYHQEDGKTHRVIANLGGHAWHGGLPLVVFSVSIMGPARPPSATGSVVAVSAASLRATRR
jgi:hypothetical protein